MFQDTYDLIPIKYKCDSHKHCVDISTQTDINKINQTYVDNFLKMITNGTYSYHNCLSYNNEKNNNVKIFIIKISEKYIITIWDSILSFMSDDDILTILKNQFKLQPKLIDNLISNDNITIMSSGYNSNKSNFINILITNNIIKNKCFEYLLNLMSIEQFYKYINKITKNHNSVLDNIITKYIKNNSDKLLLKSNSYICCKITTVFVNKMTLIKSVYPIISANMDNNNKKTLLFNAISAFDKELVFLILEEKNTIPDYEIITKLTERCINRSDDGCIHSKQVAEIIDLLVEYGLVITKEIVIKLLNHGCYINNIEKYGINIDEEIIEKCAAISYYPYKFDIKPSLKILLKECAKPDNLIHIKKLKEYGGDYNSDCLAEACKLRKNGRVIKYLITECGVKVNENCIKEYQEAYKLDTLDVVMKNYTSKDVVDEKPKSFILNENCVMTIEPKENSLIDFKNENKEYEIKNKVCKFFDLKKKTYKYIDLYEHILKYLITNNLVIGNYFVINDKLASLLKINHCTIMNINELNNILTYFI
jgi:hypothetical protein